MRFLVTGIGGPAGKALTTQLVARGHAVYGVDLAEVSDPRLAAFATVPAATDPEMLPHLRSLAVAQNVDFIIPTVAEELTIIAHNREFFAPIPVVIGAPDAVACAHDKYLTMQRLQQAGVATPEFALPSEFPNIEAALQHFGNVFALKPRIGRGGRGFQVIRQPSDLNWAQIDDSVILQAFAPGAEYAPMVFVPQSRKTSTVAVVQKEQDATVRIPNESVPAIATLAQSTAKAMGLVGPIDIDVRINASGAPVVLEVNARFGANSEQAPEILGSLLEDLKME